MYFLLILYSVQICECFGHSLKQPPPSLHILRAEQRPQQRMRHRRLIPCDQEKLMSFLADLQAINPESIINLATFDLIDQTCTRIGTKLKEVFQYLDVCELQERNLYVQLVQGVKALNDKICLEGSYRSSFAKHFECFKELHDEYEACVATADWTENPDTEAVCKSYQEVADCFFAKTAVVCGNEAAKIMKELVQAVINSVVTVTCKIDIPNVPDPMPEEDGGEDPPYSKTILLIILFIILIIFILICCYCTLCRVRKCKPPDAKKHSKK